jgi:hypothetical protein
MHRIVERLTDEAAVFGARCRADAPLSHSDETFLRHAIVSPAAAASVPVRSAA